MFNISAVQPGQRVTVRYALPVKWARKTDNPFLDLNVSKESTVAFTAAGPETYGNMADKLDHATSGKPSYHVPAPELGACVRQHRTNGTVYLAGINHDTIASRYLMDGVPVSVDVANRIQSFLPERDDVQRGIDFRLWTVDKLKNATIA